MVEILLTPSSQGHSWVGLRVGLRFIFSSPSDFGGGRESACGCTLIVPKDEVRGQRVEDLSRGMMSSLLCLQSLWYHTCKHTHTRSYTVRMALKTIVAHFSEINWNKTRQIPKESVMIHLDSLQVVFMISISAEYNNKCSLEPEIIVRTSCEYGKINM